MPIPLRYGLLKTSVFFLRCPLSQTLINPNLISQITCSIGQSFCIYHFWYLLRLGKISCVFLVNLNEENNVSAFSELNLHPTNLHLLFFVMLYAELKTRYRQRLVFSEGTNPIFKNYAKHKTFTTTKMICRSGRSASQFC